MWGVINPIPGIAAGVPVVSVAKVACTLEEIHFATPAHGNLNWHYMYESSSTHGIAPGDLQWWAKGKKIDTPEWAQGGKRNVRACWTRNNPVSMRVKLVAKTTSSMKGKLTATPTIDGDSKILTPVTVDVDYPANAKELWLTVPLGGTMPNEIGRYKLWIKWELAGSGFKFAGPTLTQHKIYAAYGQPLDPAYDSATVADTGAAHQTTRAVGTQSGTRRRFDHLMSLIGGNDMRHPVATKDDMVDLYWKLHKGINDTPGAPPYFNGANTEFITTGPDDSGTALDLEDNWLGFVVASMDAQGHTWNDASCIGHVQIMKTMLAAVGLFSRRTWVFPHTSRTPDGKTVTFKDEDLYCLGTYNPAKEQTWTFTHNAKSYVANPKLMEPDQSWENFEACMVSPTGKFLTGGYATSSNPASFRANKGFNSAKELLGWWSNTSRPRFGKRFMCWVYDNDGTGEHFVWDVDGKFYDLKDYVKIRDTGKILPPP
jgi:hypothetical protein